MKKIVIILILSLSILYMVIGNKENNTNAETLNEYSFNEFNQKETFASLVINYEETTTTDVSSYYGAKLRFSNDVNFSVGTGNEYSYKFIYGLSPLSANISTLSDLENLENYTTVTLNPSITEENINLSYDLEVSDYTIVYYGTFYITYNDDISVSGTKAYSVNTICSFYEENKEDLKLSVSELDFVEDFKNKDNLLDVNSGVLKSNSYKETELSGVLKEDSDFYTHGLPSKGDLDVLVIPVSFGNYHADNDIEKIDKAFNGTEEETGWESVSSFYRESSYDNVNLTFDVRDSWYPAANSISYYENAGDGSIEILREVTEALDNEIDFSKYDNDDDGYADTIWFIYDYGDVNDQKFVSRHGDLFWAFVNWSSDTSIYHDGTNFETFGWAGLSFMDSTSTNGNLTIDTHTYAHETGHMFGLDDYYDYYDYSSSYNIPNGTMYGADLMDNTIGDHNPYSKFLLGWVDPMVITKTTEVTISDFESSGDFLLISNDNPTSKYGEYFYVDLYTNTGLNERDEPVYDSYYNLPYGIRVLYGNSYLGYNSADDEYTSGFIYDNSGYGMHQLDFLTADGYHGTNDYSYYPTTSEALFQMDSKNSFYEVYKDIELDRDSSLYFDIEIVSMDINSATLIIKYL